MLLLMGELSFAGRRALIALAALAFYISTSTPASCFQSVLLANALSESFTFICFCYLFHRKLWSNLLHDHLLHDHVFPSFFPPYSTRQAAHIFLHFLNRRPSLTPLLPQRTQPYHTAAAPIGRLRGLTLHCLTARPPCMDIIVMSQGCVLLILPSFSFSFLLEEPFGLHQPPRLSILFPLSLYTRASRLNSRLLCVTPSFYMEQGVISALCSSFPIHFIVIVSLFCLAPDFTLPILRCCQ